MTGLMGYATKTEAVLALRASGMRMCDVARKLGISPSAASGLEGSAKRKRKTSERTSAFTTALEDDLIPRSVRQRLWPHAAKRDITTDRLIADLIIAIADNDLVSAVLDDGVR